MRVRKVVSVKSICGEGPIWDYRTNRLMWLDIGGEILNIYNPETDENVATKLPERISCIALLGERDFAAGTKYGISRLYMEEKKWKTKPIAVLHNDKNIVSNDGRCDSRGRFVLGMMHNEYSEGAGSFYILKDNKAECFKKNLTIPNGVAWSPDEKKLYAVASKPTSIHEFDYDIETGGISNGRVLREISADGMCIDENGNIWTALCGQGKVVCLNPTENTILAEVEFPTKSVTSCCFGGERLDTLYVTTATWGNEEIMKKETEAGSLFCIEDMSVKGMRENIFSERNV